MTSWIVCWCHIASGILKDTNLICLLLYTPLHNSNIHAYMNLSLAVCLAFPCIVPKPFSRIASEFSSLLMMTRGCAFCVFGAVCTHEVFHRNRNLDSFTLSALSSAFALVPFWGKTQTALLCLCSPDCGQIWDCIYYRVKRHVFFTVLHVAWKANWELCVFFNRNEVCCEIACNDDAKSAL